MKHILKFALFAFLFIVSTTFAQAETQKKGTLTPAGEPPASAEVVKIGFYPVSVYQLDMASNTYYIDTYVWLRWKGETDPTESIEFTNMVEEWGKLQENILPEVKVLPDGSKYQIMRVEGRFVQPFYLAEYPLDLQKLSIVVEDKNTGADKLVFAIDSDSSGIGQSVQIPGWRMGQWTSQIYVHDYGTKFGEEETPSAYSVAEFSIQISRPISFFYWKLMLPLLIVLIAAASSLLIKPQDIDVRTGLPAGALLTAIFLQKNYSDGLPDVGYLILMDKIYLVAYALIVLTLIRTIIAYKNTVNAEPAAIESIRALDKKLLAFQLFAFLAAAAVLVNLR